MEKIRRFLSDPAPAGCRMRSRAGLLVSLLAVPVLLGVMACFILPVPLGNPEKSRIDPAMTGIWAAEFGDDWETWVLILEPYDKRTWLVSWLFVEEATSEEPAQGNAAETESPESDIEPEPETVVQLLRDGYLELEGYGAYKGWITRIKGERFMVWEPKIVIWAEEPMVPDFWWTMRVRNVDEDKLVLDYLDPDFDGFDDLNLFDEPVSRSQVERVIRRNLDNPDLFFDEFDEGEEGEFPNEYARVSPDDYELIHDLLAENNIDTEGPQ